MRYKTTAYLVSSGVRYKMNIPQPMEDISSTGRVVPTKTNNQNNKVHGELNLHGEKIVIC